MTDELIVALILAVIGNSAVLYGVTQSLDNIEETLREVGDVDD